MTEELSVHMRAILICRKWMNDFVLINELNSSINLQILDKIIDPLSIICRNPLVRTNKQEKQKKKDKRGTLCILPSSMGSSISSVAAG
jgi:hypothetical protein